MRFAIAFALAIACVACARSSQKTSPAGVNAGASALAGQGAGSAGTTSVEGGASAGTAAAGAAGSSAGASALTGGTGGAGGSASDGDPPPERSMEPLTPDQREECPELVTGTVTVLGTTVEVLAGAPGATPGPLLIAWHGTLADGKTALMLLPSGMKDEIVAMGGLVVAPNSNGETREGADTGSSQNVWFTSDYAVADELVACALKHHNIDPRRIYTTGCSAGGLMAGAFTLERSRYIAAAYVDLGGLYMADAFALEDPSRVPALFGAWGGDWLVPVAFPQLIGFLADEITAAGGFAVECPYNTGFCKPPEGQEQSAWEFLKAHPFGVAPFPYAAGLPASYDARCTIAMPE